MEGLSITRSYEGKRPGSAPDNVNGPHSLNQSFEATATGERPAHIPTVGRQERLTVAEAFLTGKPNSSIPGLGRADKSILRRERHRAGGNGSGCRELAAKLGS